MDNLTIEHYDKVEWDEDNEVEGLGFPGTT